MKTNVYVLYGGKSAEHEVSLKSASAILNALDKDKYNVYPVYITKKGVWNCLGLLKEEIKSIDQLQVESNESISTSLGKFLTEILDDSQRNVVFPAIHGTFGEDGTVQGLLEIINIPYVGNEVLSSAVGMDKVIMKDIFVKHNLPVTNYTSLRLHQWKENKENELDEVEKSLSYPLFVKPANLGSSVAVNRVENREQLKQAIEEAFDYDVKIILEEEVVGREMQVSVIGNDDPKASIPGEFIIHRPFFDYEAKYNDKSTTPVIPARLTAEVTEKVRELAVKAFKVLNCYGLARVDIFVTDDNEVLLNEINTMPGFTKISMYPKLWEASGLNYSELLDELINLGFENFEQKKKK